MTRRLLAILPLLVLFLAGCSSLPTASTGGAADRPGVPLQEDQEAQDAADELDDGRQGLGFGDYAMTVPKNIVWWPWKIIGGTGKGLVDGIGAGFDENRLPVLGLIFSPLNAAIGLVTGFGTGIISAPGAIGPRTNFSRTLDIPTQRPTPIWWLPN